MVKMDGTPSSLARKIAKSEGVQAHLSAYIFEAKARAEVILNTESKVRTGTSYIETAKGRIDRFLILNDTRGQRAAAAIEYGREAYDVKDDDGNVIYTVGAADGLWVLHKAIKSSRRAKKRVKFK